MFNDLFTHVRTILLPPRRRRKSRRPTGAARRSTLRGVERCESRLLLTFHLWKMDQVFSSADGKEQFIELHDPSNGENRLQGHFISSNENTFTFPSDLPSDATANTHFLIGTVDYAKQPGAVTPDYTVPDNFFSVSGDTLNYADVDSFSYTAGQLPTDGVNSMFRDVNTGNLSTGLNSETNFSGQTGSVTVTANPSGVGVTLAATEGAAFSGTVATISEAGAKPGDFSAMINWGDGLSSAGTVVADPSGGFDVVGNHTYAEEGTDAVQVVVTDAHSKTVTVSSQANVADAGLAARGVPISLASGLTVNNATVATFTDAGGAEATSNYSATIDWGDGTTATPGTVSAAGGTFNVAGSHTYASDVARSVTVTITDEGGSKATATTTAQAGYLQLNLVADRSGFAMIQDANLVNPWGIGLGPTSPFWISDNGADVATIYRGDVAGSALGKAPLTVSIPDGAPTGQVFNGTSDFVIGTGATSGPAAFIFASENGAIDAWSGKLSPITQALSVVTTPGAVYKGLAMATNGSANFLFATDFHDDRVDVFDGSFKPVQLAAGAFTDPNLPAGFAPFGIQALGSQLLVTFAKQNAAKHDDVAGVGNGFVDVFDTSGNLVKRLIVGSPGDPNSPLNSPWGLAMAPAGFGDFGGDLLVGNFGDGRINAFDPASGAFLGSLSDAAGKPIVNEGVWGLKFGNSGSGGDAGTLFFTAGSNGEADGLFGSLQTAFETPLAGAGAKFAATEGAALSGNVATINDIAAGAKPGDFTATIDWGDGGSSAASLAADSSGGFDVVGSHAYTEEGTAAVQVTVTDAASHTITISALANIADASLTATGVPIGLASGLTVNNATVATFTDTGGAEATSNYSATIDWGDGTTATPGTVSAAGGAFSVTGSHTYASDVARSVTVTITDEGGSKATATTTAQAGYLQLNLVADRSGFAMIQDANLVNPWGIGLGPTSPFWISDNAADMATIYSGDVAGSALGKAPLTVSIPDGAPTGQVFNGTSDFVIGTGATSGPAAFIFASENGAIDAWSGKLSPITQALSLVTTPGAVYKGLAMATNGSADFLFATDFHDDRVDVFDGSFKPVQLAAGAFTDPNIPAGFAPFGIQALGNQLLVTFAKQNAERHDDVAGVGNGFVDVFDTSGNLLKRLIVGSPGDPNSPLNSPWGLAMAPAGFGDFGGDLLVGNFGDGRMNAFDPASGAFLGTLSDAAGKPIVNEGVWGLKFGNGGSGGDAGTLFFTAGSNGEADGLFGSLQTAFETPLAGAGAKFAATEGAAFSGNVATINDVAVGAKPGDFTATIDWGDGTSTTAGTLTADSSGGFDIMGSHTYAEEATAAVQVTVTDAAGHTITIAAHGAVTDAPLSGTALPVAPAQGVSLNNAALATFTDSGGAEPAANYTATVDWGDGTSATAGTVSASGGTFTVTGSHTYSAAGFHTIAITVKDDGGATLNLTTSTGTGYLHLNLVSDLAGTALVHDPSLLNPWGLAFSPTGPFWVADNGADAATIYSGAAAGSAFGKAALTVSIPDGAPSGAVFNGTSDFVIGSGATSGPAAFIFASENGDIDAWSGKVSPINQALSVVTTPDAVYKGLAMAANGGANFLFATDFHDDRVDVFDGSFKPVQLGAGAFTDSNIPAGFAPFGIRNLGGKLYVTYAMQNDKKHDDVAGPGNGFVDVFDTAGHLLERLIVGSPGNATSPLNSPWGLAMAPANFGDISGELLVGNFGDGRINAFDPTSGAFIGSLSNPSGLPVVISGLWSLSFGNGAAAGDTNTLFFTAGTNDEADGTFGALESAQNNPLAGVGGKLAATEGAAVSGTLATFADVALGAKSGDFTAAIAWGDGSTSTGSVASDGGSGFLVTSSHTFVEEGNDSVQITVADAAAHRVTLNAGVVVADAALTASGVTFQTARGAAGTNVTVASFTDASGAEAAGNYTATIDWGDGTASSAGTIVAAAAGSFTVTGSHTYQALGRHTVTVAIHDEGGATATATSKAIVGNDVERFVDDVFRDLLGRDVDDATLAILIGLSRAQVVQIVTSSPEFLADEVQGLFRLFFHRAAEPAAVASFSGLLAHGGTVEQVETIIVTSPEFFQVRGGGTRDGFLDALFADALHRGADPQTRSFFDGLPGGDAAVRLQAAQAVFASNEFLADLVGAPRPQDNNPFADPLLDGFFPVFLGRNAEPAAVTALVNALHSGVRDEQVLDIILASPEFAMSD